MTFDLSVALAINGLRYFTVFTVKKGNNDSCFKEHSQRCVLKNTHSGLK